MSFSEYTIELDCPPGNPRPGDLIAEVIEGTGVTLDPDNCSKFFGNWEWCIPLDQVDAFLKNRETIEKRIKKLYAQGSIRYGSW